MKHKMRVPIVRDFMTKTLVKIKPDMDIYEAINVLLKHKISGAPVVDEQGNLVGVLSEKDCLRLFANGALHTLPGGVVAYYMSKDIKTVTPDQGLFSIADIFLKNVFRRLPVVEDGKLIGQISRSDVLRASKKIWEESPRGHKWTDSQYIPEQVQAVLDSKSTHYG